MPHPTPLQALVRDNPTIRLAYFDPSTNPPTLHIYVDRDANPAAYSVPDSLRNLPLELHIIPPITLLTCPPAFCRSASPNQLCQDEPIKLGTQIQPKGAPWVGTAGAPVKWLDKSGAPHWGILSNWHVFTGGDYAIGHGQHQPDDSRPACATLADFQPVSPTEPNTIDAAIADALIDGKHTISPEIIGLGKPAIKPVDAQVGLAVTKSGRTSGITPGHCTAVGAAVRVGYGSFTALFTDQDVFEGDGPSMSQPGDSGSLIVARNSIAPVSLLFAGGGNLTIGCPIRHVTKRFNLQFPFTP